MSSDLVASAGWASMLHASGRVQVLLGALAGLSICACGGGGSGGGSPPPTPPPATYTVGGSISGLSGSVVLRNNGANDLIVTASGAFAFSTGLTTGATYAVSVATQPANQRCTVSNGSGSVAAANITNVGIACVNVMTLISVMPVDGASNVVRNVTPNMEFSATLDASTAIGANVTLSTVAGATATNIVATGVEMELRPRARLLPLADYTVNVSTAVHGSAGEQLAAALALRFTTSDATWGIPTRIENDDIAHAMVPSAVACADGTSFVVWSQFDGTRSNIWANKRSAAGVWEAPTAVENLATDATYPKAACDADGNVMVVWEQDVGTSSQNVYANRYVPASGWGVAGALETGGGGSYVPKIATAPNGDAMAVWMRDSGGGTNIWASRYIARGTTTTPAGWATAQGIENDTADTGGTQVVIDKDGNALAIWMSFTSSPSIGVNRFTPAAGWARDSTLHVNSGGDLGVPALAGNSAGNAIVVWTQEDGPSAHLWASRYSRASGWTLATQIDTENSDHIEPARVAMSEIGIVVASWRPEVGTAQKARVLSYSPTAGWTGVQLSSSSGFAAAPEVAVDALGNALALWLEGPGSIRDLYYSRAPAGAMWSTPVLVAPHVAGGVQSPSVALNASGDALAAWTQGDVSTARFNAWATRFE